MRVRAFNVLVTCTNFHSEEFIHVLQNNGECEVDVYAANCVESELPKNCVEGFVVPPVNSPHYINTLLALCVTHNIKVVIPMSCFDLEILSSAKEQFEEVGVKVAVSDISSLHILNDKVALYAKFHRYMPKQMVVRHPSEVDIVLANQVEWCCKLASGAGGRGFAVINEEKSYDMNLFHRFGCKHYISPHQMKECVARHQDTGIIMQEYVKGKDYTVSCLCDHGRVTHICGYVGNSIEFGAIMDGEIVENKEAFTIAKHVVAQLGYDGNIAFDFIVTDEKTYLLEANPRVNASLSFVAAAGCNMAYLRCLQLLGEDVSNKQNEIKVGLKMKKNFGTRYFV